MTEKTAGRITFTITLVTALLIAASLVASGGSQPAASTFEKVTNIFMSFSLGFLFWGWIPILLILIITAYITGWFVKKNPNE